MFYSEAPKKLLQMRKLQSTWACAELVCLFVDVWKHFSTSFYEEGPLRALIQLKSFKDKVVIQRKTNYEKQAIFEILTRRRRSRAAKYFLLRQNALA